jgi:hypothetical protein
MCCHVNKEAGNDFQVPEGTSGIVVMRVPKTSNLFHLLQNLDGMVEVTSRLYRYPFLVRPICHAVITEIDSHPIAGDGTVAFRDDERISFGYLFTDKFIGDPIGYTVWRDGQFIKVRAST